MNSPKLAMAVVCFSAASVLFAAASYQSEIAEWRHQREAGLRRDGGWLTVTGLFWLREGANRFGTSTGNEIVLPNGPAQAGVFELHKGQVRVQNVSPQGARFILELPLENQPDIPKEAKPGDKA